MRYIKFTYVDAVTGIAVTEAPAENGPKFPAIDGLEFVWARESRYPTAVPELFGTCPDKVDITAPGVLGEYERADWETMREDEMRARQPATTKIDAERDRRISSGFEFRGVHYQSRLPTPSHPGDWDVFSGKALEAFIAVMGGAQPGDLRWSDPDADFAWIAADNSRVPMDAQTVIELGKVASAHRSRHTFAGSDLKTMDPIPQDYTDDRWWP